MQERQYPQMDPRSRRRDALRIVLGAVGFILALLIGFAVGLRVGGTRPEPQPDPVDTVATVQPQPDTVVAPPPPRDTLQTKIVEIARKEAARGAEYLSKHNRWNRDEMEKIPALQGLWDAVNTYDVEEIRRYNEIFDSPPLATIIEGLDRTQKKGYYAAKKDHVITLSTYIKRLSQ